MGLKKAKKIDKDSLLYERICAINELSQSKPIPWEVSRFFPGMPNQIELFGSQIGLGSDRTDPVDMGTIDELRKALEFFVTQFGGTVKWD